ncbi:MAG: YcxB family protein [Chloroflexi bacterium]|nr:YcxB family protein [Chloroflexota bacterium]
MEITIKEFKLSFFESILARRLYKKSQSRKEWRQYYIISGALLLFASSPLFLVGMFFPDQRLEIIRILGGLLMFFSKIFLLAILAGMFAGMFIAIIRWIFFTAKHSKLPVDFIAFTPEGIEVVQGHVTTKTEWLFYKSVVEDERFLLLIKNKKSFAVIPKRALTSDQQDALKNLFKENIHEFITMD